MIFIWNCTKLVLCFSLIFSSVPFFSFLLSFFSSLNLSFPLIDSWGCVWLSVLKCQQSFSLVIYTLGQLNSQALHLPVCSILTLVTFTAAGSKLPRERGLTQHRQESWWNLRRPQRRLQSFPPKWRHNSSWRPARACWAWMWQVTDNNATFLQENKASWACGEPRQWAVTSFRGWVGQGRERRPAHRDSTSQLPSYRATLSAIRKGA